MKINVEVDCTPLEARQFFGLPDVQPMLPAPATPMGFVAIMLASQTEGFQIDSRARVAWSLTSPRRGEVGWHRR